ncbi:GIY-YIG nuclease family protein [Gehongia tenuis]|uniref:Uncharacterized protein n=1 Tax=Gehongia tenuis TaxID=2763655 RepID=A0A926HK06_9FIRM|nr:hypothetical protein [Gehongia tenuis]MBC8530447.1 hypothetical protein [Gehongia tenuis]
MDPGMERIREQIKSMKCFGLDHSFEIIFDKQFLAPYARLDDLILTYPEYGGSAVYMMLAADRLELTGIDFAHDPPVIEYRNAATGETGRLDNLWFFPFPVPRAGLHMKILSSTVLEVGIREEWRRRYPHLADYAPLSIGLADLVVQSRRDRETTDPYEILYIGSSKDVYQRLTRHETILKIYRHIMTAQPNRELFVLLLKPKPKFYRQSPGGSIQLTLSSSVWDREGPMKADVGAENLLLIAEAMLINYFKPKFNEHYAHTRPSLSQAAYARLLEGGVKHIQVNLNLFMQPYKVRLSLRTDSRSTEGAKHVTVYGALESLMRGPEEDILCGEAMPDELYDLLMGEGERD